VTLTIREALHQATKKLNNETAQLEAEILLQHTLNKPRSFLYAWPEKLLTDDEQRMFFEFIQQRANGYPVAYLTGDKEFWSLPLCVTEAVLIPRPETELLVELALELFPEKQIVKAIDLGTGSGAIALALASARRHWRISATDISPASLQIAQHNAKQLSVHNVEFLLSDWFDALEHQQFDLIVSNPPYIANNDPHLQQGDLVHEPARALASGEDGLQDLRTIIQTSPNHLLPGGYLLLEHGMDQQQAVAILLHQQGFSGIECYRDLAGLPRVTLAHLP
jgi:release factor glutamine methyltransferase